MYKTIASKITWNWDYPEHIDMLMRC